MATPTVRVAQWSLVSPRDCGSAGAFGKKTEPDLPGQTAGALGLSLVRPDRTEPGARNQDEHLLRTIESPQEMSHQVR
jgi:hypothetical protein